MKEIKEERYILYLDGGRHEDSTAEFPTGEVFYVDHDTLQVTFGCYFGSNIIVFNNPKKK